MGGASADLAKKTGRGIANATGPGQRRKNRTVRFFSAAIGGKNRKIESAMKYPG
jgi:hypothetical protein